MDFNNDLLLVWGVYKTNGTGTVTFPITYTSIYGIVSGGSAKLNNDTMIYSRFPHTLTINGFSHTKATNTNIDIYYIAYGVKS